MSIIMKSPALLSAGLFILAAGIRAQDPDPNATQIQEVIITESNARFFADDKASHQVDRTELSKEGQSSLGSLISHSLPAVVRSYGSAGSLVSLSLRGTGSNHSTVSWNGFPINSPASGQADLSLIPASFMQSVCLINGASSVLYGSGTIGGTIDMANEADWSNRLSAEYELEGASYGTEGHYAELKAGGSRMQYRAALLSRRSENDFSYRDPYLGGDPLVASAHNAYSSHGLIQNVFLRPGNGNYIEAGIWYQDKRKEIPAMMGSTSPSFGLQKDGNLRVFSGYRRTFSRSLLLVKAAWFSESIRYTDRYEYDGTTYPVDSRIATRSVLSGAEFRHSFSKALTAGAGASFSHLQGISNNYPGKVIENEAAVYGNLKLGFSRWVINGGVRQEYLRGLNPPLQLSLGARFRVNRWLVLRSEVSSKFRKPSMNEKYWKPGGNPALRPEKGWGGDLAAEMAWQGGPTGSAGLNLNVSFYMQSVDNWIQWIVSDSVTPVEYKKVLARGSEVFLNFTLPAGKLKVSGNMHYTYNRSVVTATYDDNGKLEGSQLVYVPLHKGGMNVSFRWGAFMIGGLYTMTGARNSEEGGDGSSWLPAYGITDIMAGADRQWNRLMTSLMLRIENLFDVSYQPVRYYPMPGRSFCLSLSLRFDKSPSS